MIYNDILSHIKTVDQARELTSEIDVLLENLFKTQNNFDASLNEISAHHSQMLKESLPSTDGLENNLSMIKEYLEGLKVEIQKLKKIKLTLSFEPREKTIDTLHLWITQNLGSGRVLDISIDKTILGGAIVEYEGRYEDLSLRKRMEEIFRNKREEILKF